jgi:hypothetical protein
LQQELDVSVTVGDSGSQSGYVPKGGDVIGKKCVL